MQLQDFVPRAKLQVKTTAVDKARFPVIDAHNHLNAAFNQSEEPTVGRVLEKMDNAGIQLFVDLDGGWGEETLQNHLDAEPGKQDDDTKAKPESNKKKRQSAHGPLDPERLEKDSQVVRALDILMGYDILMNARAE